MDHASDEHPPDERWMTYAEAGQFFGISTEAARQLVKRRGWPRRTPNERNVPATVLVPLDAGVRTTRPPTTGVHSPDISSIVSAFETAIATLAERAQAAEQRADAERQRADRADERADKTEAARDIALAQLRMAEELLKEAQIERAVEAAARSSWLFRRLWRGRGG